MQQRVNDKTAKVRQERDSQSDMQIRKKTEESSHVPTRNYNPLVDDCKKMCPSPTSFYGGLLLCKSR